MSGALAKPDGSYPPARYVVGISPSRYQHALDARMIHTLRETAGLEELVRMFHDHYQEKSARLTILGSHVRVGPRQFPDLFELYRGCCRRLRVTPEPELFVGPGFNAYTGGIEHPYVVLGCELAACCTPGELEFILGHELGHVRLEHLLYDHVASWGLPLVGKLPLLGPLLGHGIQKVLFGWRRAAEFSADRAGLLACQDTDAAVSVFMKLAGAYGGPYGELNREAFLEQARELPPPDPEWLGSLLRSLVEESFTHPWTVLRAAEIQRWQEEGEYAAMLKECEPLGPDGVTEEGAATRLLPPPPGYRCGHCRELVQALHRFCTGCGSPVGPKDRLRACPSCGAWCDPDQSFCDACGKPVAHSGVAQ